MNAVPHSCGEIGVVLAPGVYRGDAQPCDAPRRPTADTLRCRFEEQRSFRRMLLSGGPSGETTVPRLVPTTEEERDAARGGMVGGDGGMTRPCCCTHTQTEETCYAIRTAAAERALHALQRENDELKRRVLGQLAKEHQMQGAIDALKAELEAMGRTVARQTATLGTLSAEMQRRDPCHLVRDKRRAETDREPHQVEEELRKTREELRELKVRQGTAPATDTAGSESKRTPEVIDHDDEEVDKTDEGNGAIVDSTTDALSTAVSMSRESLLELYRVLTGLNRLCDTLEDSQAPLAADEALFKVDISVLSCLDLPLSVTAPVVVTVRGPSGNDVTTTTTTTASHHPLAPILVRTATHPAYARQNPAVMSCPFFTEDDDNAGRFRTLGSTSWRLTFEVHSQASADERGSCATIGTTVVPVAALLSQRARASKCSSSVSSLHTIPLYACHSGSGSACCPREEVGSICVEVSVSSCAELAKRAAVGMAAAELPSSAPPPPPQPTLSPVPLAPSPHSLVHTSGTCLAEAVAVPEDAGVSGADEKQEEVEVDLASPPPAAEFVAPPPPPAAVPSPPPPVRTSTQITESTCDTCDATPSAPSPPEIIPPGVPLSIYVKEGTDLSNCPPGSRSHGVSITPDDWEEEVEGEGGNVHVRVLIGGARRFSVCAPPTDVCRGGSTPSARFRIHWGRERAEFVTIVGRESDIRFELDFIDSFGGVRRMGSCSIAAADVIADLGEHILPVLLEGEPQGNLVVDFASSSLAPAASSDAK